MAEEDTKRALVRWIEAEINRTCHRHYRIAWDQLDAGSLRDVQRLLRDLHDECERAVQHARMFPLDALTSRTARRCTTPGGGPRRRAAGR